MHPYQCYRQFRSSCVHAECIAVVDETYKSGDWASVSGRILTYVAILVVMYVISLIAGAFYTQMMAIITQGSLKKLREKNVQPHAGLAY